MAQNRKADYNLAMLSWVFYALHVCRALVLRRQARQPLAGLPAAPALARSGPHPRHSRTRFQFSHEGQLRRRAAPDWGAPAAGLQFQEHRAPKRQSANETMATGSGGPAQLGGCLCCAGGWGSTLALRTADQT